MLVDHIISERKELAQNEFKSENHRLGTGIHWELCKRLKFGQADKLYKHKSEAVLGTETHKNF